jgi:uncharacterized protein YjgD (DUF1641 family)
MAKPIDFTPRPRDPRAELYQQLSNAPERHVEALLDAYAILQLLRDKGILELAKGVLGSGERVLEIVTATMERDEVVRTIRNLVILLKIVGSLDPEMLEKVLQSLSDNVADAKTKKPPGIFRLVNELSSEESRRALAPIAAALKAVGKNLPAAKTIKEEKAKRKKTTRHSA